MSAGNAYNDRLINIEVVFYTTFQNWGIKLPRQALESRARGEINERGWQIKYTFGKNERGEYLDYYATHRNTNGRHVRIYADGDNEDLISYQEFVVYPENASEGDKAEIEKSYQEHNQQVTEVLEEKGFL
jgi:hypothetical protein